MKKPPQTETSECEICGSETHSEDNFRCRYCDQYRLSKEHRIKTFRIEQNDY